jgi:hypothetical protein
LSFLFKTIILTNKFIFTHNANDFSVLLCNSYYILGFTDDKKIYSSVNRILKSSSIVNLVTIRNICIQSDFITDNININKSSNNYSTLAMIPVNSAPYSIVNDTNILRNKINLYNYVFNSITLKIVDQDLNFIDFNGQSFSLILELTFEDI